METLEFLEESIEVNVHDIGQGNGFQHILPKAQMTKRKQVSWTLPNQKYLCFKGYYQKSEEQSIDGKKIYNSYI